MAEDKISPFFGLDFIGSSELFSGAVASGPITEEMMEDGIARILAVGPAPPCGSEESPHLTPPAKIGERTQCVQCGEALVYLTKNTGTRWSFTPR